MSDIDDLVEDTEIELDDVLFDWDDEIPSAPRTRDALTRPPRP